ncbi:MAG TPA: 3-keto-5-aminohexanoate cleavage protein [Acidimicrobiia bacterium]|nr:3-keto-5-aminohexanoate cleavage protein [Acidimicrobiia bacterium]
MAAAPPTVIEAALNGMTPRDHNPHVPRTVDEIVESGFACLAAGAAIIHHHNDEPNYGGATRHCAEPYLEAWPRLKRRSPGLILHPTMASATADSTVEERFAHIAELHEAGVLGMATADAGTIALAFPGADGPVGLPQTFGNPARDVDWIFRWCREREVPVHVSIFEPGFLRLTLAHHRAGTLPKAKIQLYLGGDRMLFGLPAGRAGLDAYLAMLEGSGLPWMVGVFGGDVTAAGVAALAIDRGGHVRVGLEDHFGDRTPRNEDLVREVADLARAGGRRPAGPGEVAGILWGD